eukprot:GILK01011283.1.p1 GENE.GILK01011283.1~~GILK01011283.1.p1  ORF type:complete len:282 (-),score=39.11 GILK01011283.1:167-967(-)
MADLDILLPADVLSNTPSRQEGMSAEQETQIRIFGCQRIQEAGILLKLPQVTMVTGQVIFHRFFFRKSMKQHDVKSVAMASLFLATKVEETPKQIRHVVCVFYHLEKKAELLSKATEAADTLVQQVPVLDLTSQKFFDMQDELVKTERVILKELGFMLYIITNHPHKFILQYIKVLDASKEIAQCAWNFLNDSMRTTLCVRFPPEVLACSAIFLASRFMQYRLPDHLKWWELFDTSRSQLEEVSAEILSLYKRPKITSDSLIRQGV